MPFASDATATPKCRKENELPSIKLQCTVKAVPIAFRPSTPEDLPAIVELLKSAFHAPSDAPFLNLDLLRWKYFYPHPEGRPPLSYVLTQDGIPIAHGCAWPSTLPAQAGPIPALCLIDWVSSPAIPGMGIMLVRKMRGLAPVTLSIGGSEMTQAIMPKIGFAMHGELFTYARVLRPFRQFRTRPGPRDHRAWLRLARNAGWSLAGKAPADLFPAPVPPDPYLARCPGANVAAYELRRDAQPVGSLILTRVGGQSRIAQIRTSASLSSAYAAAIRAAREEKEANELIALAHDPASAAALEANGFKLRGRRSVYVLDPDKLLAPADYPLPLTMLHDDMFYLNTPEYPYFT